MFRFLLSMREILLYWKSQNKRDGWILKTIFYKRGIEYFYNFVSYINDNYRNMKKVICSEKAPGAVSYTHLAQVEDRSGTGYHRPPV